jgi:hypothetical protein
MKYVNDLFEWAVGVYDEFWNDSLKIDSHADFTTGITIVYDLRTGKSAFSKCRKDEKFNEKIGVAVAYTRLKGGEVPKVKSRILVEDLKVKDRFSSTDLPDSVYCVVGVNPLNSTQIIAIHTYTGHLHRFEFHEEVYKII